MTPPCPQCEQPDLSLLRLVLIGEILRADETWLVLLAELFQTCGLLTHTEEPEVTPGQRQKGTLHTLLPVGADCP
jgi:hypothetical protein